MIEVEEIATTYTNGTYEIETDANQLHVARFLSPDPLIQFPENSQSYNSYSYVLNNPLRFTDPSGFLTSGDSTATQQSNMTRITTKALNVVDSNDDLPTDASSFNTEETQAGKTMLPVGVVNINLIESRTTNNVAGNTAVSPPRGAIPENLQRCGMCHDPRGMYYDQLGGYREVFWQNVFFVAGFAYTGLSAPLLAVKGGSFAEKAFLSEKFGITSKRFANSITGVKGTWNNQGGLIKMGWSTQSKYGGGMQLRIGIGSKAGNANQAWKHIYVPKTFVPNSFANPSIQVKQSLFNLGL